MINTAKLHKGCYVWVKSIYKYLQMNNNNWMKNN